MKNHIHTFVVFALLMLCFGAAKASHMAGGEMSYVYLGDSISGGVTYNNYLVSFYEYVDCFDGSPDAIAADNPAFFSAYDLSTGTMFKLDTNVYISGSTSLPEIYANTCGRSLTTLPLCIIQKTFSQRYSFPSSSHGYLISYQRCCRNAGITNISDPGNEGGTYYCKIPASPIVNNSAVFTNDPPEVACLNGPFYFDNSATDADGDSLSYGFCVALGYNGTNIKPYPSAPPYDSVGYLPSFSSQNPLTGSPGLTIDPVTGIITGTPTIIGRYLIAVYCNEWRSGTLINTVIRDFEVIVTPCNLAVYEPGAGPDTVVMVGTSVDFHCLPAVSYTWSPATYLSSTTISNPVGTFTDAGTFAYVVDAVNDSGCHGADTLHVQVLAYSDFSVPNAFTPNGDGRNDFLVPIPVLGSTLINFKVYNRLGNIMYNGGANDYGWDGTYKGVMQGIDSYVWVLTYYDNTGAQRQMKGNVTLLR